jgi:hypothetical protein
MLSLLLFWLKHIFYLPEVNSMINHPALIGGKPVAKRQKRGRPPSENPMIHTAVVLPRVLLERLKWDAEWGHHGLSTEIRKRLQTTYDREGPQSDPKTVELAAHIKSLANNLASDLGKKWHESPKAHAAFGAGLLAFLEHYKPEGDETDRDIPDLLDDPNAVGRTHARLILTNPGGSEKTE